jgi:hypothetical protein
MTALTSFDEERAKRSAESAPQCIPERGCHSASPARCLVRPLLGLQSLQRELPCHGAVMMIDQMKHPDESANDVRSRPARGVFGVFASSLSFPYLSLRTSAGSKTSRHHGARFDLRACSRACASCWLVRVGAPSIRCNMWRSLSSRGKPTISKVAEATLMSGSSSKCCSNSW